MEPLTPTWREVLNTKLRYDRWGHQSRAEECALKLSYPYYLWNGRIYRTSDGRGTDWLETDIK